MKTFIISLLFALAAILVLFLIEFGDHSIEDILDVEDKQK